jgi:ring-1,2-phenylacetyl-CoA epoxidase subunit PaaD
MAVADASSPVSDVARAREVASSVPDPELPMVTVAELGILRDVTLHDGHVTVTITPTYLGCPALHEISHDLRRRLHDAGFADVAVQVRLAPPWTSDAITEPGRRKLAAAGIAPPRPAPSGPVPLPLTVRSAVPCPRCGGTETAELAAFGATPCTALHRCRGCGEPFEYVKDI